MSWILAGRPLRRILVTRLRYLGDIAMSTVVLTALHRGDPRVQLGYLCEAAHAPLLCGHPLVSQLHVLGIRRRGADAAARVDAPGDKARTSLGTLGMIRALRNERYDLAVDLFYNPRSAWLLRMTGMPLRIGGATRGYRKRLYTHPAPSASMAEHPGLRALAGGAMGAHLSRLAPLEHSDGRPFLAWLQENWPAGGLAPSVPRPEPTEAARQALERLVEHRGRYILLAPAATWASKQWPVERWCGLVSGLLDDGHDIVVLCPPGGSGAYGALGEAIPTGRGGLLPPLPLSGALAIVSAASLLVSVDGGIMHAAVAMRVPTVALFGPTDPAQWFPYEKLGPYRVVAVRPSCHPCDRHTCDDFICLSGLRPHRVLAVVRDLLADGQPC